MPTNVESNGGGRFNSRSCKRRFNERTGTAFNDLQVPTDLVLLAVLWRLRYKLSFCDVAGCSFRAALRSRTRRSEDGSFDSPHCSPTSSAPSEGPERASPGGALVFGRLAAEEAVQASAEGRKKEMPDKALQEALSRIMAPLSRTSGITPEEAEVKLNNIMSRYVEYQRDERGLTIALEELRTLKQEIDENVLAADPLSLLRAHEVMNMAELAICVALAAKERRESRMYLCHRRTDFPERNDLEWNVGIHLQKSGEEIMIQRIPYR